MRFEQRSSSAPTAERVSPVDCRLLTVDSVKLPHSMLTLQKLIAGLTAFWQDEGCLIEQPYDMPMGAGTMHPATFLRVTVAR